MARTKIVYVLRYGKTRNLIGTEVLGRSRMLDVYESRRTAVRIAKNEFDPPAKVHRAILDIDKEPIE